MTIKYILAIAIITPALSVSSMAQQYQGGPKSSFMPTRQISSGGDIYAQGDIYPRGVAAKKTSAGGGSHRYLVLVSRPCNRSRGCLAIARRGRRSIIGYH
jgi:hypothetical protein